MYKLIDKKTILKNAQWAANREEVTQYCFANDAIGTHFFQANKISNSRIRFVAEIKPVGDNR